MNRAGGGWRTGLRWGLLALAVWGQTAQSRGADFAIWLMSEKWQGLSGTVLRGNEPAVLGPQLWQVTRRPQPDEPQPPAGLSQPPAGPSQPPAGLPQSPRSQERFEQEARRAALTRETLVPLLPQPGVRSGGLPVDPPWQTLEITESVWLRIRGHKVEYRSAPRQSRVVPGSLAGECLAYAWQEGTPELGDTHVRLVPGDGRDEAAGPEQRAEPRSLPEPGHPGQPPACLSRDWRLVEVSRSLGGRGGRTGEFQFEIRQRVRFQLEAAHRPGWFLTVAAGRLQLTKDADARQVVEVEQWLFYDDLDDGR